MSCLILASPGVPWFRGAIRIDPTSETVYTASAWLPSGRWVLKWCVRQDEGRCINKGLEAQIVDTRKELKDFMLWGFGVTFAGMFALIGFVIWDRRSALAPAVTCLRELEEHEALPSRMASL